MKIAALLRTEGPAAVSRRLNRAGRWTVASYRDEDEAEVVDLFAAVYGTRLAPDEWRWKYKQNPDGAPIMLCARETATGRLVAFHAALPLETHVGGDPITTYFFVDTMVAPAFRNRGLYIDLSLRLFDEVDRRLDAAGVGLPNASAFPVNDALGISTLDQVRLYGTVLNARRAAEGRLGSRLLENLAGAAGAALSWPMRRRLQRPIDPAVRAVTAFPADLGAFCARALASTPVASARSAARMAWRFLDRPGRTYKIFQHGKDADFAGFVVVTVIEKFGLRIGAVADFVRDAARTDGAPLLHAALRHFQDEGADVAVALTMSAAAERAAFHRAGFFSSKLLWTGRPFHLLMGHRPVVMTARRQRHHDLLINAANWTFTFGDTDLI